MKICFFSQRIINLWNSLPPYIINSSYVLSFKANLDSYWINQEVHDNYKCDIIGTINHSMSSL